MSTDSETLAAPRADERAAEARGFFELDGTGGPLPPPSTPAVSMQPPVAAPTAPSLPAAAPLAPPTQSPTPTSNYVVLDPLTAAPPTTAAAKRGSGRRVVSWLLILAVLGGLAVAGLRYGPDLFELTTSGDDPSTTAPLVFPTPTAPVEPVRTATISVHRPASSGGLLRYDATVDFESDVAQVLIDRGELPGLEIRAVFDDAVVRRVDQDVWYRTGRGGFPFDGAGIEEWVRTLDQALPPQLRSATTIVEATDTPFAEVAADVVDIPTEMGTAVRSQVDDEMMRRLVIDVDQRQIAAFAPPAPPAPNPDATDPAVPADPGAPTEPAAPADPAVPADPAAPAAAVPPPVITLPIGTPNHEQLRTGEPVQLEMWVDRSGVVRHVATDDALGSESFTVHSTSAEPWLPPFPEEGQVRELTAQAMLELGL